MKKTLKIVAILLVLGLFVFSFFAGKGGAKTQKVLYGYVPAKLKPFDPANITDLYTGTVAGNIFEGLFQYKYLSDYYELEPLIADGMPNVSADGLTYTFKIRKDAYFYDPEKEVFKKGKGRRVTAYDFAYSLKRLADPAVKSGGWWLFDGYIAGLNEWRAAAKKSGKADYNAPIEGVKVLDDDTLVVKLTQPYPQILYTFAMTFTWPLAKEVVDYYGEEFGNHPIGTGPFAYDHENSIVGNQHVLVRNPYWRGAKYPSFAGDNAKAKGLLAPAGKDIPFIDSIVYYVIEESQPQWLKFMNGELDYSSIPKDNFSQAVTPDQKLTPELKKKGIILDINSSLDVTYTFFNMEDPFLGTHKKVRQAMSMAYDRDKVIEIFYNNRAIKAQTVIPPGLGGYDKNYVNPYGVYNVEKAKQLLAEAGYPNGEGLPTFKFTALNSTTARQMAEFFKESMAQIGVNIEIEQVDWPTFLNKIDSKQVQIGGIGWGADYPDAQNFLQLLYGPNKAPGPNAANYDNPEFNELYKKAVVMQDSPERNKLYAKLGQMAAEDCPWILGLHRKSYALYYKWLKNRFYRDIGYGYAKYYDIDVALREELKGK